MKRKVKPKNRTKAEKISDNTKEPTCSEPAEPMELRLLELLIKKTIKRLEHSSYKPKVQDALKAIQLKHKIGPTCEKEKTFWQLIEDIKRSELENQNSSTESGVVELAPYKAESLQAQLLKTIIGLEDQVKNGALPVKIITDTFNYGKPQKNQLTYQRIGRALSAMGLTKVKAKDNSAILWDEEQIKHLAEFFELSQTQETQERHETQETPPLNP